MGWRPARSLHYPRSAPPISTFSPRLRLRGWALPCSLMVSNCPCIFNLVRAAHSFCCTHSPHYVRIPAVVGHRTACSNPAISPSSATLFFFLRRSKTGFSSACFSILMPSQVSLTFGELVSPETDTIIERLIRTAIETAAVGAIFCVWAL